MTNTDTYTSRNKCQNGVATLTKYGEDDYSVAVQAFGGIVDSRRLWTLEDAVLELEAGIRALGGRA